MKSDDTHIVQLVRCSSTRVVCTQDNSLTDDLTNASIISRPRCKVYKHQGAKSVLIGCCP